MKKTSFLHDFTTSLPMVIKPLANKDPQFPTARVIAIFFPILQYKP